MFREEGFLDGGKMGPNARMVAFVRCPAWWDLRTRWHENIGRSLEPPKARDGFLAEVRRG